MTGRTRRSGWFAADSAAGANGSCDWTPQHRTSNLPSKLTTEAYHRSLWRPLYVRPPDVQAEALVAGDQSRSGELREQPGSRKFPSGGSDQAGAAAAKSALMTSASSQARPVSH